MRTGLSRFKPQLSLKTVMILFILLCLLVALVAQWRQRAMTQRTVVRSLRAAYQDSVEVIYDYQAGEDRVRQRLFSGSPSWLARRLGPDYVHSVVAVEFDKPAETQHLELLAASVPSIETIEMHQGLAEPSGWNAIFENRNLKSLVYLSDSRNRISPEAATSNDSRLGGLTHLKHLTDIHFEFPDLRSSELNEILSHSKLEILRLTNFQAQSRPIEQPLPVSSSVKQLFLYRNQGGANDLQPLLEALPNLEFLAVEHAREIAGPRLDDSLFLKLAPLKKLKRLFLYNTQIKGHQLQLLQELPLEKLGLGLSHLDDLGAAQLGLLDRVSYLEVGSTRITDAGMPSIAKMSRLEYLSIRDTLTTDAGLNELAKLEYLQQLRIRATRITGNGIQEFQKQRPNCFIDLK